MSMCTNSRCDGVNYLCGKCRKVYPSLAASLDEKKRHKKHNRSRDTGDRGRRENGGWTPRTVGTMEDGTVVTFRQGRGDNEDHTLIADGERSARDFDRHHNHYGPKREGGGRVEDDEGDRGDYTGRGR